jgi:soluble lytic murein transglycosylase-like protein
MATPEDEFDDILFKGRERPVRGTPASSPSIPPKTKLVRGKKQKSDHEVARDQAWSDLHMLRSRDSAKQDILEIEKLHPKLKKAAEKFNVPVELLAGMASRESRAGKHLNKEGYDTEKQAFGLLQIDERYHKRAGKKPTDQAHINQAAGILREYRNVMDRKHGDWSDEERWRGAVAAYNMGPGNVKTRENMDKGTTGDDYSKDVLHRAEVYGAHFAAKEEE